MPDGANSDDATVLRRMAGSAGMDRRPGTSHRALKLVLARAADEALGLDLKIPAVDDAEVSLSELVEQLPEDGLICQLQGPHGALGLCCVSADLMTSVVEIQTIGMVASQPPAPRDPTPTDASLCEHFVDAVFFGLANTLRDLEGEEWTQGYRYGAPVFDRRQIGVLLPDFAYRHLRASVLITAGSREGTFSFFLPARPPDGRSRDLRRDTLEELEMWSQSIERGVLSSDADLRAILWRQKLSLSELTNLKQGREFLIPRSALLDIKVTDLSRAPLAVGRLGMLDGQKAVMVTALGESEPDESAPAPDASSQLPGTMPDSGAEILEEKPKAPHTAPPEVMDALSDLPDLPDLPSPDLGGDLPDLGVGLPKIDGLPDLD
ncbi:MAG: hypothetical protein AAGF74_10305 [Pseudomonadota bacterium]